ncbi:MFS transporter [Paractinoplanes hotanensis]|uniref:MFS transporter n=1 Tax=Paractinoplanes hotanensis TaxID=2906497 RepID=A0ABT0YG61_9ACTN|nr:MFS transporter [Actinoplanes hotanensis]MCM4084483.1 MFS transporter [Actinoplanes hotanensis]
MTDREPILGAVVVWRDLPRAIWVLLLARAVNRLGAFSLPFLSLVLVNDFRASLTSAGYLISAFGLATIPSRLLGGHLADRFGPKATICLGLAGTAAAQLLVAGSHTFTQAIFAVILLGLFFEIYEPASQALIADVTDEYQRPAAYNLLAVAMAVAGMGAGLLAAVVAGIDLRWLFIIDAATCLLCAAVVAFALTDKTARGQRDTHRSRERGAWSDRRLLAMLAVGTIFATIYLQITIALPLTITQRHLPVSVVGVLLVLSTLTLVLVQPVLNRSRLRLLGHFRIMTLGYLLLGAGLAVYGFATTIAAFAAATVIWSLGDAVLIGRAFTVVASLAPDAKRAQYLAVYGTSWGIAAIIAPTAGTWLLELGGPPLTWSTMATASVLLALVQPSLGRRLTRH